MDGKKTPRRLVTIKSNWEIMSDPCIYGICQWNHEWLALGGGPRSVMIKAMDCGIVVSLYSSRAIMFTFGQIPLGKV